MKKSVKKDVVTHHDTSDLTEICFMMVHSVPIISVSKLDGRVTFRFDQSDDKNRELVSGFAFGRDSVSISAAFAARQKALRIINSTT